MTIETGDLVIFKPEFNGDDWADRIALVVKFDLPWLTVLCKGDIFKVHLNTVDKLTENT
tara:strand:- start:1906 stop:2082 length:177 start_codon:yes stop_codon:yes gene_type:complete